MSEPQPIPEGVSFADLPDGEYRLATPLKGITRTIDGQRPVDATIIVIRRGKVDAFREAPGTPLIMAPLEDAAYIPAWPGLTFSIEPGPPPHIVIDHGREDGDDE